MKKAVSCLEVTVTIADLSCLRMLFFFFQCSKPVLHQVFRFRFPNFGTQSSVFRRMGIESLSVGRKIETD